MMQAKYSYCVDENGNLVHIDSLTDATRHSHHWYCLGCGQEMVANLGKYEIHHFSHKANTACDGETYLHKLAKIRILYHFNFSERFPIFLKGVALCSEREKCICYNENICAKVKLIPYDLKEFEGKVIYDTCQEEVPYDDFRPDLLLTCSTKPNKQPVFIEVFVAHKSTEEKINSKYRIIETKKIESEEDINDIIQRGFVEGENCNTYNFRPRPRNLMLDIKYFERFVIFKDGKMIVYKKPCQQLNQRHSSDSFIELNMEEFEDCPDEGTPMRNCRRALVYLMRKGLTVKSCILCKNWMYDKCFGKYVCVKFEKLESHEMCPDVMRIRNCEEFMMDYNSGIMILNKKIQELPETPVENFLLDLNLHKDFWDK